MASTIAGAGLLPPLLDSRPAPLRIVLAVVVPTAFGALCGWALSFSAALYLILAVPVAILGGFGAGIEHLGRRSGARRGVIGGLLFGAAIVVVQDLIGGKPEVALPDPPILLAVLTAVSGAALGALGGALRARLEGRAATAPPAAPPPR
jgi:hypothetical protein